MPTTRNIDVYVIKSAVAAVAPAVPGTQIEYTLVYGNNGADPATDVVLTDTLPANTDLVVGSITGAGRFITATNTITWGWASLASLATGTVSFTVQITNPLPAGVETIANTATIMMQRHSPMRCRTTTPFSASTPVTAAPDLTIPKPMAGPRCWQAIG
ncbi:MAG: DUF11 domain-containing protein [Anaerolineales bacterium]|nr:DUF11 domain-containing protein [Anaerolineales bacterium]